MAEQRGPSAELIMELRTLVCRVANSQSKLHAVQSPVTGDWDLDSPSRAENLRQDDYLAVLSAAHMVLTTVESLRRGIMGKALDAGVGFAEIGATEGISRQAARQRYRRHTTRRRVRLVDLRGRAAPVRADFPSAPHWSGG